jgi:hypothetical protein
VLPDLLFLKMHADNSVSTCPLVFGLKARVKKSKQLFLVLPPPTTAKPPTAPPTTALRNIGVMNVGAMNVESLMVAGYRTAKKHQTNVSRRKSSMDNRIPRLLKEILVYRYPGAIEKVADHLGDTYDYVWSQTHGRVNPHIKVIRAAYIVTGDPRLKRELEPEGFELVPTREGEASKCAESEATDIMLQTSKLIEDLREVLEDGVITNDEADQLEKSFSAIEKELIEARAAIRNAAQRKRLKAVK